MTDLKKPIGFLASILLGFSTSCNKPSVNIEGETQEFPLQDPIQPLPLNRTITDLQGRSFDAKIIGKNDESIVVTRESDQKNFRIPIQNLAESDQKFVNRLRNSHVPAEITIEGEANDTRPINGVPRYVAFRQEEIVRLYEEIERLRQEAKETSNAITSRSRYSEIERLDKEIAELRADIARFQEDNP